MLRFILQGLVFAPIVFGLVNVSSAKHPDSGHDSNVDATAAFARQLDAINPEPTTESQGFSSATKRMRREVPSSNKVLPRFLRKALLVDRSNLQPGSGVPSNISGNDLSSQHQNRSVAASKEAKSYWKIKGSINDLAHARQKLQHLHLLGEAAGPGTVVSSGATVRSGTDDSGVCNCAGKYKSMEALKEHILENAALYLARRETVPMNVCEESTYYELSNAHQHYIKWYARRVFEYTESLLRK